MNEGTLTPGDAALDRLRRLEVITDIALAHAGLAAMLPELLDRVSEILSVDTVAVLLLDEQTQELVATAAKGIEEEVEQGVRIPLGAGFAGRVAVTRAPRNIPDIDKTEIYNPILRQKGIRSLLGVPLLAGGTLVGIMHVGSLTPREFTEEETRLLEQAAGRIAPAIEHARLYEAERAAREEAEAALTELRALQDLADAALAHLNLEEMLTEVLDRLRHSLGTDTAAILLLDTESDELVARAARGLEEEVERGARVPVGRGFAGRIAAERRVVEIPDLDHADVVNPILREKGIKSMLGAPLIAGGEVRGVVHVATLTPRAFTAAEARLLQLAGDRIAMALDHSRLVRERDVALSLQQSLLPERLPEMPGLTLAARYRPGQGGLVGGDWYDAVPLPNGGVGLAMGDVVSRGIRAASVMGQLRHALRTRATEGDSPTELAQHMNQMVRGLDRREMVTLAYLALDASGREVRYVSAGHPPALSVSGSEPRFLDESRGVPLGALAHARYEEAVARLEPDSLIVLYTDGLVERRDRPIDEGMDQLKAATLAAGAAAEDVCRAVGEALIGDQTEDDVALLVARTVAARTDEFELRLPAISGSLATLRRALRQWLGDNGADSDDLIEVLIAVGEAAGNAVEHAYGPGDATFDVAGVVSDGELEITIRDYGSWRPPRGHNRGRGTMLMQQLMDEFEVRTTPDGTEVCMRRTLGGGSRVD
jgi:GAF domain-containing protein/anti-sigma regulatory factor (Ser/Thr protein kinase)